ncbi:uncharacterized protein LOC142790470 isoform X2 [Rhipicephalus microplus]|uniref:uncharacterized protein LOC142786882 isoform X2 n=1 Tax=Rhipicephalus microplus TaxID=6941 RepID=UPI003F6D01E5
MQYYFISLLIADVQSMAAHNCHRPMIPRFVPRLLGVGTQPTACTPSCTSAAWRISAWRRRLSPQAMAPNSSPWQSTVQHFRRPIQQGARIHAQCCATGPWTSMSWTCHQLRMTMESQGGAICSHHATCCSEMAAALSWTFFEVHRNESPQPWPVPSCTAAAFSCAAATRRSAGAMRVVDFFISRSTCDESSWCKCLSELPVNP